MTAQGDNSGKTTAAAAWQRTLPNLLTMGRVVLAAVFFAMLAVWRYDDSPLATGQGKDPWLFAAAGVFIAAAVTDALDGYLARKWRVVSVFGRVMDPFADKVLIIGAFVMLAGPGFVHSSTAMMHVIGPGGAPLREPAVIAGWESVSFVAPWMAVVIVARELLVTSIRGVYESRGVSFAAAWSGKWKMILQCICVPLVLVLLNFRTGSAAVDDFMRWTVWATVAVTAWSGVPYVLRAIRESGKLAENKG